MSRSFPGDLNGDSNCCSLLWLSIARQYQSYVSPAQKILKFRSLCFFKPPYIYGVCMFECVWAHVVFRGCMCASRRQSLKSGIFLDCSSPYTVKLGLLLNREFTNSASLPNQSAILFPELPISSCSPRIIPSQPLCDSFGPHSCGARALPNAQPGLQPAAL